MALVASPSLAASSVAPVRHRSLTYIALKAVTLKINRPFPTEAVQPFGECFQANVLVSSFDVSYYFSWNSALQCAPGRFLLLFPRGKFERDFMLMATPFACADLRPCVRFNYAGQKSAPMLKGSKRYIALFVRPGSIRLRLREFLFRRPYFK